MPSTLTDEQINAYKPPETLTDSQINTLAPQQPKQGILKTIGSALISNEKNFGETIAGALSGINGSNVAAAGQADLARQQQRVLDQIRINRSLGKDTSRLETALKGSTQGVPTAETVNPVLKKTNKQIAGEAGGVALDLATAGTAAAATKSFKLAQAAEKVAAPTLATLAEETTLGGKLVAAGKKYAASAAKLGGIGYGYDVSQNLQEGQTGTDAAKPGLGTAIGAALPLPVALKNIVGAAAKDSAPRIINSLIKPLLKDFSYGKNPGRAVAEEGIVGNNWDDLAKNISTRRREIGEEIGAVSNELDAKLSTAKTAGTKEQIVLRLEHSLAPIDQAMEIAAKINNSSLLSRLHEVKDALVNNLHLGHDNEGLPEIIRGAPRNFADSTFDDASTLKTMIGDMTKWTGNLSDDHAVNGALKRVYGEIKDTINKSAEKIDPELSARLKTLNEKYGDLQSAEIATKYRDKIQARQNLVSAPIKAGAVAGLLASPFTGGLSIPTLIIGLGAAGLEKVLGSVAVKSRVAAWLAKETPSTVDKFFAQHPGVARVIYRTFSKDINLTGSEAGKTNVGTLAAGGAVSAAALGANAAAPTNEVSATRPPETKFKVRGATVDEKHIDETLRPVVFGEISNRPPEKQELEARVILNTAINRLKEYKKHGENLTLEEVLAMPNQYQAYGGKQFNLYKTGTSTELDTGKKQSVDAIIDKLMAEVKSGKFKDNTNGAFFYKHNKDGSITYDDKRRLFK